jgi:hypothetical protein
MKPIIIPAGANVWFGGTCWRFTKQAEIEPLLQLDLTEKNGLYEYLAHQIKDNGETNGTNKRS